ncbi:hypothetical protein BC939DRAFT_467195 [Gamsiella multidivaricata]|uniref:uncharacterized protein n=1 Tax=Gamsiella multidivaricata TaxID=101098 RepID=UPI002220A071|nr:uncharacterized protein BC939DRAFT_467195 [Gamsiella multidivaricata]KAG0363776.1 hypothetical protein BGZ54_008053 [Gamsiella multidivaricata]KAI7817032.1 hypothetical protein BC939DRAFT_467195 [Gamsiella multidivaricata]
MSGVEVYRAKVAELIRQADISTVSARGIRKQIETLTGTSLADVKREFDELVMEIYEKISDEIDRSVLNDGHTTGSNGVKQPQHQQPQQLSFGGFALPPTSYVPPKSAPAPAPIKMESEDEDEEEDGDDGNASDSSYSSVDEDKGSASKKAKTSSSSKKSSTKTKAKTKSTTKAKAKPKAKTSKSSTSSTKKDKKKDEDKPKRKQPLNEDGTVKQVGFMKPLVISDQLMDVVGKHGTTGPSGKVEMARPTVVKHLWTYIREHSLQDPKDGRMILCDAKLKALFGEDRVSSFSMNKYLKGHLTKVEEVV